MQPRERLSTFQFQSKIFNNFLETNTDLFVWEHQVDATKKIRDHFRDQYASNVALCVLPTGAGKSGIAVMAAFACSARRVLVITPSKEISKQIYNAFCDNRYSFFVKRRIVTENQFASCRPICRGVVKKTSEIRQYFDDELIISNAQKYGTNSRVCIREDIPNDLVDLVIVDEAHHFPAETWKKIVTHFSDNAKIIFLTATPNFRGQNILTIRCCYEISRRTLVDRGIIRDINFIETSSPNDGYLGAFREIIEKIKQILNEHDRTDSTSFHQSMVLCQTIDDLNSVTEFVTLYNENITNEREKCSEFTGGTSNEILKQFKKGDLRTLVICGSLIEGFDHPNVSVVGIASNLKSLVRFSQFVGRSFRKINNQDTVTACVISDKYFDQKLMKENFESVPEELNLDDEDDDE